MGWGGGAFVTVCLSFKLVVMRNTIYLVRHCVLLVN